MSETEETASSPGGVPFLRWWPDGATAAGLWLVTIVVVCSTINHYGLTYDEGWYLSKSVRAREWAAVLIGDPREALSEEGIERYWFASKRLPNGQVMDEQQPGAAKLVNGLLGYPVGRLFGAVFPDRAGTALFMAGCVAGLYLLLAPLWGRTAGAFGGAALLALPRVFAHAHLAALDVPVMSAVLLTTVLAFFAVARRSLPLAVASGLMWGVALGCKINALFVPFFLAAWVLAFHRGLTLRTALTLAGGGVAGFLLTWPWLWRDTGAHLAAYLAFHLRHYPVAVSYFGHVSGHQPWHYPSVMTAVTAPVVTLALALAGMGWVAQQLVRRRSETEEPEHDTNRWRRSQGLLLLLGAVANIGFNSLPSAPKYGGVRLFLPFFPFAAALAAIGLRELTGAVSRRVTFRPAALLTPRRLRIGLALLALVPAVRSVGLAHPFQLSYYNLLIGGTRGAVARGMEATYWGDTYLPAANFVADEMAPGDLVWVDLPGCEWIIRQYLEAGHPGVRVSSGGWPPEEAAWAIVQNKASELSPASTALMEAATPRFTATLDGVPLSLVYDREGLEAARGLQPRSEG